MLRTNVLYLLRSESYTVIVVHIISIGTVAKSDIHWQTIFKKRSTGGTEPGEVEIFSHKKKENSLLSVRPNGSC